MQRFSGARLREVRRSAKRSRESIAVDIDRSYKSIVLYEAGKIDPPASVVCALAASLGVDIAQLFDIVEDAA